MFSPKFPHSHLLAGAAAFGFALLAVAPLAAQDDVPEMYYLFTALDGASEVDGGDADAYADFSAKLDPKAGKICYMLASGGLTPTAAHIHEGKEGANGAPVVTLEETGSSGEKCVDADATLIRKIGKAPENYYVNVHSAKYPNGAIRGQLSD
ncbi:MAG: CHRD domain-containing protein [Sphingomonadales bacterium]|nr:CHRD domain-containing protein [Sphingomonadales bacterium]MBD3774890.1 CHRD domain-containing protein [Paracoccaceae bacterium]